MSGADAPQVAPPQATLPQAAMVFAAGLGRRMAPLTDTRPKPLIEVAGRPLLAHALDALAPARLPRIVVNTHYRAAQIAAYLAHLNRAEITLSHEETLLETGGGLARAAPLLGPGPVITLNADAVWAGPAPVLSLLSAWEGGRMDALLLLAPHARVVGHKGAGDFDQDSAGRLIRRGAAPHAPLVYTGASITHPRLLEGAAGPVFSLNTPWDRAIAAGRAFGVVYPGHWADVGQPESLPLAEAMLRR